MASKKTADEKTDPIITLERVDRELKELKDEWDAYKAKLAAMGVHPDPEPEAEVSAGE